LNAVALVPVTLDGAVASTGFDVLRAVAIRPEWLYYRVRTNEFVADVCKGLQGVVYPAIRPRDIRRHQLPIPPLPEQARIVEEVESCLSRLDEAAALLERVQRNLKRYQAAVLKAAVEGRLVPTEAELARAEERDYEPANVLLKRILAERRRRWEEAERGRLGARAAVSIDERWKGKYREPPDPDVSVLPALPDGWTWATLGQLSWHASYGTSVRCSETASGVPVLRIPNVSEGRVDLGEMKYCTEPLQLPESEWLAPGDLLVIRTNGSRSLIARATLLDRPLTQAHYFASYLIRFRLVAPPIGPWLVAYWHAPSTRVRLEAEAATSAGQFNVSLAALARQPVPLPPLSEQTRIAKEIDRLASTTASSSSTVDAASSRSIRLRQAILKWAFEGKLVDQNPTDEPASVLLERIRQETAATRPAVGQKRDGAWGRRGRMNRGAGEETAR